jgi:hypothetical protein
VDRGPEDQVLGISSPTKPLQRQLPAQGAAVCLFRGMATRQGLIATSNSPQGAVLLETLGRARSSLSAHSIRLPRLHRLRRGCLHRGKSMGLPARRRRVVTCTLHPADSASRTRVRGTYEPLRPGMTRAVPRRPPGFRRQSHAQVLRLSASTRTPGNHRVSSARRTPPSHGPSPSGTI